VVGVTRRLRAVGLLGRRREAPVIRPAPSTDRLRLHHRRPETAEGRNLVLRGSALPRRRDNRIWACDPLTPSVAHTLRWAAQTPHLQVTRPPSLTARIRSRRPGLMSAPGLLHGGWLLMAPGAAVFRQGQQRLLL